MVEWNRIFRLFLFFGILGQPREVHLKFRNEIPENVLSIRSPTRNFWNFWLNGKRPCYGTYICSCPRLSVSAVGLSLSPLYVTRKKTRRKKWPREVLGARSAPKVGISSKSGSLNYIIAYVRSVDNTLSIFDVRVTSCRDKLWTFIPGSLDTCSRFVGTKFSQEKL